TITVRNRYTDSETVKTIYVGTDTILKAHAKTGLPLSEIKTMLDTGAMIADDGSLILANTSLAESEINEPGDTAAEESTAADQDRTDLVEPVEPTGDAADENERSGNGAVALIVVLSLIGALLLLAAIFFYRRSQGISSKKTDQTEA